MTFDGLGAAELLAATPLIIVHGNTDAYCAPGLAQALYERKPGEKEILWLDAASTPTCMTRSRTLLRPPKPPPTSCTASSHPDDRNH
jgi:hypothetical protein